MLNIKSILVYVLQGLQQDLNRFSVLDMEHILDTKTGIKYHLYDTHIKVTRDDKTILTDHDFTDDERQIIWEMRKLVVPPEELEKRKQMYPELLRRRREQFAHLYEFPEPLLHKEPVVEEGTQEYTG